MAADEPARATEAPVAAAPATDDSPHEDAEGASSPDRAPDLKRGAPEADDGAPEAIGADREADAPSPKRAKTAPAEDSGAEGAAAAPPPAAGEDPPAPATAEEETETRAPSSEDADAAAAEEDAPAPAPASATAASANDDPTAPAPAPAVAGSDDAPQAASGAPIGADPAEAIAAAAKAAAADALATPTPDPTHVPKTTIVPCPPSLVGRVIGKGGETIKGLQAQSGAHVQVNQDFPDGANREVIISGPGGCVDVAERMIHELLSGDRNPTTSPYVGPGQTMQILECPKDVVGKGAFYDIHWSPYDRVGVVNAVS